MTINYVIPSSVTLRNDYNDLEDYLSHDVFITRDTKCILSFYHSMLEFQCVLRGYDSFRTC